VTAILLLPTLIAIRQISPQEISPKRAHGSSEDTDTKAESFWKLLSHRPLLILACCVGLFHLANAAMLPLMGSVLTSRSSSWATILIAACIVVPQLVVAVIAPRVGRQAQVWGRRPVLLLGFAMLPIRGLLFATVNDPFAIVAVQLLDGISAAALGVMVPLMVADITRGTGRFNSALGVVGTIGGGGAALSATLAGATTDYFGSHFAFVGLGTIAILAVVIVFFLVPETRPSGETPA
jgi:MFS family permease